MCYLSLRGQSLQARPGHGLERDDFAESSWEAILFRPLKANVLAMLVVQYCPRPRWSGQMAASIVSVRPRDAHHGLCHDWWHAYEKAGYATPLTGLFITMLDFQPEPLSTILGAA